MRREREAKKAEAAAKKSSEKWFPKDGIYATLGAGFNDRCSKFDGLVLGLSDGSISTGENKCNIFIRSDWQPNEIRLEMICNGRTGAETMYLRKIDDRTITVRGQNGLMKASGPLPTAAKMHNALIANSRPGSDARNAPYGDVQRVKLQSHHLHPRSSYRIARLKPAALPGAS
jgi:hypothetical protein